MRGALPVVLAAVVSTALRFLQKSCQKRFREKFQTYTRFESPIARVKGGSPACISCGFVTRVSLCHKRVKSAQSPYDRRKGESLKIPVNSAAGLKRILGMLFALCNSCLAQL